MNGITPRREGYGGGHVDHRQSLHARRPHDPRRRLKKKDRNSGQMYFLVRSIGKTAAVRRRTLIQRFKTSSFARWHTKSIWHRIFALITLILFIISTIAMVVQPLLGDDPYNLNQQTRAILPKQSEHLAKHLTYNAKDQTYLYNDGYRGPTNDLAQTTGAGTPRFTASFSKDPTKGIEVSDPVNKVDFGLKPKFRLGTGHQDQNQMVYPLGKASGYLVYTAQIASVKEDIVLLSTTRDRMTFDYEIVTADGMVAQLEEDGSVGVYGTELPLYGDISVGSDKDAELLEKARKNAAKTKFMFGIPAPVVVEAGMRQASVRAWFELEGTKLRLVADGLKQASYPLSIDPSVYIQSAAQLMSGNNESNVAFDVATEQFKKGSTTGARIDEWTETGTMNDAVYDQGTVAAGGYVYRAGGRSGRIMPWIASTTHSAQATTSLTFTMNMPATRPAGDLYVAIIAHDVNGSVGYNTVPSGWTTLADTREHSVFWHTGGASEPSTYTWTKNGNAVLWAGTILRIKDAATSPTFTTTTASNASDVTPAFAAVTPTSEGALILRSVSIDDDILNEHGYSPASHDDVVQGVSAGTNGVTYAVSLLDQPNSSGVSAGATSTPTSQDVSDSYGSSSIAIYGTTATPAYNQSLQWAHFNSTTGAIDSPAPGSNGTPCSNWCTNSAYNLTIDTTVTTNGMGYVGASMVAYNGYLYMIGGYDGTNLKSTVYIAKLGSNGEPSLWHPTDPDLPDWVYWYKDAGLSGPTARQYASAFAYNGKMYLVGGDSNTTANSGSMTTVDVADILPNGTIGTWSSGPALATGRYGAAVQAYNGYLYVLGGNNNGTMVTGTTSGVTNAALYSRINADGSLSSWKSAAVDGTSVFTTPRFSSGGTMSGIWGAYIYLAGGCSVVNASGLCTTITSDVQLASINSDGTLDSWNTMANLRQSRFGSSFIAWQDSLYRFGGCSKQDASTGACYATHLDIQYGNINQDGDASTVSVTQASGSGNCTGSDPYDCNLPPGGTGSGQAGQAMSAGLILNGYLYSIGGCTAAACTTMSGNTAYVAISSDGRLKRPPSCSGGTYGSWCVDSSNTIAGGVGGAGMTVFNNTLYIIGGQDGSAGKTSIYRNTVNADGSLAGAWTATTFTSAGLSAYTTNGLSYTYVYSRANPASASTNPGNLYVFGGCDAPATGAGCSTGDSYSDLVYKCNIQTSGAIASCSTSGQMAITQISGSTTTGLGIHAGTVYANYIYLIGGFTDGVADLNTVRSAKFDNSNNVVAVSGSTWIESSVLMKHGRRRGTAFGYNGYIYAVGGYDSASSQVLDTIEFVKIDVSDGSLINPGNNQFMQSAVTFSQRWGLGMAVSNSYAYIIGGCKVGASPTCTTLDSTVQTFQIYNNDSGAPGGYSIASNLYGTNTDRIGASAAIYNGYMYIAGGCTATANDCSSGTPAVTASVMYSQLDAYGAPGTWNTGGSLPTALAWGQLEVAGGTLYYVGGQTGLDTTAVSTIYYTTGISSGNPTWSGSAATKGIGDTGSGAQTRTRFSSTVWNNRIYVVGGYSGSAVQSTVYVSPSLSSGGNITTNWTSTTAFNVARSGLTAISYANNIYLFGGYNGTNYLSDAQFAQISSTGTVGSWTYTTGLPFPLREADGFASNGYMYLFGGRSSTNDCTARTMIAPISANTTIATGNNPTGIGEWYQTNRNFDGGRYGAAAVTSLGKAYVLGGGCQGVVMQDDFDSTTDGSQWTYTTGMTAGTACQSTSTTNTLYTNTGGTGNYAATKDVDVSSGGTIYFKFYIPGADTGSCYAGEANLLGGSPDNVTLEYDTNDNWASVEGTIATYNYNGNYDPMVRVATTIPAGAQTTSTRFRWVMSQGEATDSFAIEDVSIVATGNTSIAYATNSRVTYTPLLSQPQIAIYSRLIDAGNDVFPKVWLANGLDNSIGARWQMAYRSMNDPTVTGATACGGSAMTGYGQLTNYGDITLGKPGAYVVKNGAGTDISCGRYFFMTVSIDASQTFGYPEDIGRGPTLDNLTFYFNSNPGKRLIHGKTFIEGTQQPLDTPCRQNGDPNNAECQAN